ncbi:hypothetical protein MRX96_056663 [Rhipicephalus microplus]
MHQGTRKVLMWPPSCFLETEAHDSQSKEGKEAVVSHERRTAQQKPHSPELPSPWLTTTRLLRRRSAMLLFLLGQRASAQARLRWRAPGCTINRRLRQANGAHVEFTLNLRSRRRSHVQKWRCVRRATESAKPDAEPADRPTEPMLEMLTRHRWVATTLIFFPSPVRTLLRRKKARRALRA